MNQQKCPDCMNEVKDNEYGLECDLCQKWYHINCQSIGKTVYNILNKRNDQIHWFCKDCNENAIDSIKHIQHVQKKVQTLESEVTNLKLSNEKIIQRLEDLEKKDVRVLEDDNGNGDNTLGKKLEKKIEEIEKSQRILNLIVTNLPEVEINDENSDVRSIDKKEMHEILKSLKLRNNTDLDVMGRIGNRIDGKKRALRVSVKSLPEKFEILEKASKLRNIPKYHNVYISPDLTQQQQKAGKLLRDELKRRRSNGEENLRLHRGKIVVKEE